MSGQRDRHRIAGIRAQVAGTSAHADQRGQGLVEFALVIPLLVFLFMAVIELALMLNAVIGVNRASQQGAHLAAILGNRTGADCMILRDIENDVMVPNDRTKILDVTIERTAMVGNTVYARQTYARDASAAWNCTLPDGTTVANPLPYRLAANGYPETDRCVVLSGCPATGSVPARSTVDNVGVNIEYRHLWATPLNSIFGAFGGGDVGWTIRQRNIFRMEPVL